MIQIRRAERKDCARMLELVQELAIYEKAPNEVTVTLEHFEESGFGNQPVWWAFVATSPQPSPKGEVVETIVGFALYYIRYSTWKGQRLYLEDFLVTEQARGKGIGKMLFDTIIQEAKEKNFNAVVWQVLDWNQPAINFYNKYKANYDAEWLNGSIEIK